jgi:hypothetical protein
LVWLWLSFIACSLTGGPDLDCPTPDTVLAEAGGERLRCESVAPVVGLIDVMAGRPMDKNPRTQLVGSLRARWLEDPVAQGRWLAVAAGLREEFQTLRGAEAARRRTELLHEWRAGRGLLGGDSPVSAVLWEQVVIWAEDPADRTVLTEMDVEGWIYFASLCREAQGGSPLRISVADRFTAYRMIEERYRTSSERERQAMLRIGPFWGEVRRIWKRATFEEQQAWIQIAPLPPPMTGTSLVYLEAIMGGQIVGLVDTLHIQFGPLKMTGRL